MNDTEKQMKKKKHCEHQTNRKIIEKRLKRNELNQ